MANLAILLTPPGSAAIAVVRIAGPGVAHFLAIHFSKPATEGRCVHGVLSDGEHVLDDPVVVLSGHGSIADVNLHGGPWVVRSVLELARREGFEVADRFDLPLPNHAVDGQGWEAAVLAALPMARTEMAIRRLLEQPAAWEHFGKWAATAEPAELRREVERILADRSLEHLLVPPRVAIVGAPNVGKSTLANQLFAQERSITADLPGTTRDWVGEIANLDGLAVMLVDTPGMRVTSDPIESEAIRRSAAEVSGADLVVLVLDATRSVAGEQGEMLARFPAGGRVLRVINKCDKPSVWEGGVEGLRIVATTGVGVDALRQAIRGHFGCDGNGGRPALWTEALREWLRRHADTPGLTAPDFFA